ncbi:MULTISPECIES: nitroreductase family deazaflavin-dependent oxidoreductase [Subtercola]|uniref:Nitroreductase family deazaflavin-dependent oxidoreductase n=1 Tax=Subtercola vilae TaxID=2056433 RepID=A0A4T2C936_9MICO|nr:MULTISPECIES: nitroreductase family deazaflavin-dependent oxidoreductase [Subtercola]MEA9983767.1 nitroreductase family deazaflavin-dependent oxidoreductase [Subtercola sp. RTI3]TIH40757.1 nitroreductase family deazaflavin-dependent oxidoreductase [Subtercola vilae]
MTDEAGTSPENPLDNDAEWVREQIVEYLATDGEKPVFANGAPLLLLTTKGRKSGVWRRTALIHGEDDGRQIIVASLGGAPKHPVWYLNLVENPEVYLQVKAERFHGVARTATADEKPALWQKMVEIYPDYAEYQVKTDRDIPVVIIDRVS